MIRPRERELTLRVQSERGSEINDWKEKENCENWDLFRLRFTKAQTC